MLIRHSAVYVAGKLVPGLMGLATTALLTRLLDPAAYGRYGLALVVAAFGSTLAFDWLGLALLRVGSSARAGPEVAGTAVALFAALAGLTAAAAAAAWAAGLAGPAAGAGVLLMWGTSWFELASRLQVARQRPGRFLLMNAGRAAAVLLGAGAVAWATRDPAWTACATAAGAVLGAALGGGKVTLRLDPTAARQLLGFGLPLAASLALAAVAGSGIRALLEALDSAEALGLYTAAFLLVQNTLAVVAAGIASAGYPLAVRLLEAGDDAGARRQASANLALLLAVLAPMAAGMALTAPAIAAALVGPRYAPAVAALTPWLAGAGFFAGVRAHALDHAFQLGRRQGLQVGVTAVAAAVAMLLTLGLVPRWGPLGAAVAAFAAALVSCVHAAAAGRSAWAIPVPVGPALRVAAACAAMAACVRLAPGGLPAQVAAGALGYGLAAVALNILGLRDRLTSARSPPRSAPSAARRPWSARRSAPSTSPRPATPP